MTARQDRNRLLISADVLAAEMAGNRAPALLDVRWRLGGPPGIDSYRRGHLPGAVFVDLDRDLAGPPGPAGRHPLPEPAAFQAAMRVAGVSRDRAVVIYDDGDGTIAARGWWTLRYFGHPDARVLDGGYRAWAGAGLAVTTAEPTPAPGDFTAEPGHMPVLDAAGAQAAARIGLLLDARAGERYRGEIEPADPVAGHIPGAVSAPTAANVKPDGTFRNAAELAARFAALGVAPGSGTSVAAYCGSGVTAAHEVLALMLSGLPAALYVGSWSNWIADPARPVATGPGPAGCPSAEHPSASRSSSDLRPLSLKPTPDRGAGTSQTAAPARPRPRRRHVPDRGADPAGAVRAPTRPEPLVDWPAGRSVIDRGSRWMGGLPRRWHGPGGSERNDIDATPLSPQQQRCHIDVVSGRASARIRGAAREWRGE